MILRPSGRLDTITAYATPRHGAPISIHLDGNEGAVPEEDLLEALLGRMPDVLRRYPSAADLQSRLARIHGIQASRILVTAGGDEAIDRTCRAFLDPGDEAILFTPTFVMIDRYVRLAGASSVEVEWRGGELPVNEAIARISPRTRLIAVVSPNNPTGAVATAEDLKALSAAAPETVLLVDLAYTEFADEDLTPVALALPNAVIIRTLSKAYGLAGLRVGYAMAQEEVISILRASGSPYSVSGPSLAIAAARLDAETDELPDFVEEVCAQRERLATLLEESGAYADPSEGNFLLARVRSEQWLRDGLAGCGIAVRIFPEEPALRGAARITIPGRRDHFDKLCHAVRATLAPEAILFDLDGVIADVSRSYRAAMIATAARFGADVTRADISSMKAAGGANNDWDVTWRMLQKRGINVTLDDVTRVFEEVYQGTEESPGLRATEGMLVDRSFIEQLSQRLPLAIVTGRPRGDAHRFLRDMDIEHFFTTIVVMEDGPLKPNPAPLELAMERLGVRYTWMIGDTPDDIRAARAAGSVPIGVVAPGEESGTNVNVLTSAGAARVLGRLTELTELLHQ